MMNQNTNIEGAGEIIKFFYSIPDDILVEMATYNFPSLESMCIMLTLDSQLLEEQRIKIKN